MLVPIECPPDFDPSGYGFVRFSPGGRRVVVSDRGTDWAVVVDVQAARQVRRFTGLGRVRRAFFLTDNQLLVAGGGVTVHDVPTGKLLTPPGVERLGGMTWPGPAPQRIATYLGGLHLYDLKKGKFGRRFAPLLPGNITCVRLSGDGRFLAADAYFESETRFVLVWDVRRKPLFRLFEVHSGDGDLAGMAFSPDNRLLAVSVESGATVFDLEKGEQIGDHDPGGLSVTQAVRFSPSGRSVELVDFRGRMARINPKTGRVRQRSDPPEGPEVGACAVSADGVAAGVTADGVLFWRLPTWYER